MAHMRARWTSGTAADSGGPDPTRNYGVPFSQDAGKGNAASEFLERRSLDPMHHRLPTFDGDSLATNMRMQFSHLSPWAPVHFPALRQA